MPDPHMPVQLWLDCASIPNADDLTINKRPYERMVQDWRKALQALYARDQSLRFGDTVRQDGDGK